MADRLERAKVAAAAGLAAAAAAQDDINERIALLKNEFQATAHAAELASDAALNECRIAAEEQRAKDVAAHAVAIDALRAEITAVRAEAEEREASNTAAYQALEAELTRCHADARSVSVAAAEKLATTVPVAVCEELRDKLAAATARETAAVEAERRKYTSLRSDYQSVASKYQTIQTGLEQQLAAMTSERDALKLSFDAERKKHKAVKRSLKECRTEGAADVVRIQELLDSSAALSRSLEAARMAAEKSHDDQTTAEKRATTSANNEAKAFTELATARATIARCAAEKAESDAANLELQASLASSEEKLALQKDSNTALLRDLSDAAALVDETTKRCEELFARHQAEKEATALGVEAQQKVAAAEAAEARETAAHRITEVSSERDSARSEIKSLTIELDKAQQEAASFVAVAGSVALGLSKLSGDIVIHAHELDRLEKIARGDDRALQMLVADLNLETEATASKDAISPGVATEVKKKETVETGDAATCDSEILASFPSGAITDEVSSNLTDEEALAAGIAASLLPAECMVDTNPPIEAVAVLTANLATVADAVLRLKAAVSSITLSIHQADLHRTSLVGAVQHWQANTHSIEQQLESAVTEGAAMVAIAEGERDAAVAATIDSKNKISALESDVEAALLEAAGAAELVNTLGGELANTKTKLNSIDIELDASVNLNKNQRKLVSATEAEAAEVKKKNDSLTEAMAELTEASKTMAQDLSRVEAAEAAASARVVELENTVAEFQEDVARLRKAAEDATAAEQAMASHLVSLSAESDAAAGDTEALALQLSESQRKAASTALELETTERLFSETKEELLTIKLKASADATEIVHLRETLAELKAEKVHLEAGLGEAISALTVPRSSSCVTVDAKSVSIGSIESEEDTELAKALAALEVERRHVEFGQALLAQSEADREALEAELARVTA